MDALFRVLVVASWRLCHRSRSQLKRRSIATAASDAGAACAPPASTSPRPWHTHPRALTAFLHINPGHPDYLFTAPRSSFALSYICFRHITSRDPIFWWGPPIRMRNPIATHVCRCFYSFLLLLHLLFLYTSGWAKHHSFSLLCDRFWDFLWNGRKGFDKSRMNDLCVIECSVWLADFHDNGKSAFFINIWCISRNACQKTEHKRLLFAMRRWTWYA